MRTRTIAVAFFCITVLGSTLAAQSATPADSLAPQLVDGPLATRDDELNAAFTPDGRTVYFTRKIGDRFGVILVSHLRGTKWSEPEVASFSGQYADYDPFVSPDGARIFWISARPVNGVEKSDYDIWMAERCCDGWGAPIHLDAPVNTDASEYYPTVATSGNLYFSSNRAGGKGRGDVYRSRLENSHYGAAENLGDSVNSAGFDGDPYIAPDESYLVFTGYGRPGDGNDGDLYIAVNRGGTWGAARKLGHGINTKQQEYTPIVSPDGKWFYFASYRGLLDEPRTRPLTTAEAREAVDSVLNGKGNLYRVPVAALLPE